MPAMSVLALVGMRVWDGRAERASEAPQTVRIENGRIAAVGPGDELARGATVHRFGPEHTALPGLIDAHVHVTLDPGRGVTDNLERSDADLVRESEARLAAMVRAGITTARDLGGGKWLELALRDRIAAGELPGPRLVCAGQPLTVAEGHCHFWGGVVDGPDEIRAAIARQVDHGADWIKIMATGGVITKGSDVKTPQFSADELALVRAEAARHGRRVAAHCHGTEGIRLAARAELRTIEHCSFAGEKGFGSDYDPAVCDELAARELWVSPTVNAGWRRFMKGKDGEPSRFFRGMQDVFREYTGLSAADVLRTATSESARALELEAETGALAPGLAADVLVVRGNPLDDLAALTAPELVVARGAAFEPAQSAPAP